MSNEHSRWLDIWETLLTVIGVILVGALLIGFAWSLGAVLLMWGWSLFMVPVFGLAELTFQQAFGGVILLGVIRLFAMRSSNTNSITKRFRRS
jgi:hypothetical protein